MHQKYYYIIAEIMKQNWTKITPPPLPFPNMQLLNKAKNIKLKINMGKIVIDIYFLNI